MQGRLSIIPSLDHRDRPGRVGRGAADVRATCKLSGVGSAHQAAEIGPWQSAHHRSSLVAVIEPAILRAVSVPRFSARSFIMTKKTGTRIRTWTVEVIMPPTM